jgi:hypothetical protein
MTVSNLMRWIILQELAITLTQPYDCWTLAKVEWMGRMGSVAGSIVES